MSVTDFGNFIIYPHTVISIRCVFSLFLSIICFSSSFRLSAQQSQTENFIIFYHLINILWVFRFFHLLQTLLQHFSLNSWKKNGFIILRQLDHVFGFECVSLCVCVRVCSQAGMHFNFCLSKYFSRSIKTRLLFRDILFDGIHMILKENMSSKSNKITTTTAKKQKSLSDESTGYERVKKEEEKEEEHQQTNKTRKKCLNIEAKSLIILA